MIVRFELRSAIAAFIVIASATIAHSADIIVIGGANEDPFWSKIRKGVADARLIVEANGGKVAYLPIKSYDAFAADSAEIVRVAISQKPQGIAVPNWFYESQDAPIKEAVAAGIKVILMNSGTADKAKELGAINYVGTDEYISGRAAGDYLVKKGTKFALCVNDVPGNSSLEARCKGIVDVMTEAGVKAEQLPLPSTAFGDLVAIAEAVKSTLLQRPEVDALVGVGAQEADGIAIGIAQAGKAEQVDLGGFDLNEAALDRIKSGEQLFAVDQQPYLQSLLAVTLLASNIDFGTDLPTRPVLTGPGIVDASSVDATISGLKAGAR